MNLLHLKPLKTLPNGTEEMMENLPTFIRFDKTNDVEQE